VPVGLCITLERNSALGEIQPMHWGLVALVAAFDGESVLTVWSGAQASLTRLGGEEEHLQRCCFSFSTLEKVRRSRVGMKP
jgi:hypothetical protein